MGFGLFLPEADGLGSVASPSFCGACTEEEESACRMSSSSGLVLAACLRFFTELQPMHPRAAHRQREQPIVRFRACPAMKLRISLSPAGENLYLLRMYTMVTSSVSASLERPSLLGRAVFRMRRVSARLMWPAPLFADATSAASITVRSKVVESIVRGLPGSSLVISLVAFIACPAMKLQSSLSPDGENLYNLRMYAMVASLMRV
mmetsp:Transcript_55550/g.140557  ORF Transcript_55550/g.140557 Transcript_55550/m.140557 type:complete len:205 (+) Transcript_55550:983-1597(+)